MKPIDLHLNKVQNISKNRITFSFFFFCFFTHFFSFCVNFFYIIFSFFAVFELFFARFSPCAKELLWSFFSCIFCRFCCLYVGILIVLRLFDNISRENFFLIPFIYFFFFLFSSFLIWIHSIIWGNILLKSSDKT